MNILRGDREKKKRGIGELLRDIMEGIFPKKPEPEVSPASPTEWKRRSRLRHGHRVNRSKRLFKMRRKARRDIQKRSRRINRAWARNQ